MRRACLVACAGLTLAPGCNGSSSASATTHAASISKPTAAPRVPDVSSVDPDGNRLDDMLDADAASIAKDLASADPARRALGLARVDEEVAVEAVFSRPMAADAPASFEAAGGAVRHVFKHLGYGFTGTIARSRLVAARTALGADLLLLKAERAVVPHQAESTKNARVRAVWANGFAGLGGLSGSPTVNIAIVDGGVDPTHPDLAGRMLGFHDYSSEALTTASDVLGHGSHVAGIALGSGAAFGVGPGTLKVTESGDDKTTGGANDWISNPYHLPQADFTITATATWTNAASTTLSFFSGADDATTYASIASQTGTSPLTLSFDATSGASTHYTIGLRQDAMLDVSSFAVAEQISNVPAVGDGFPAMRGVAPGSSWYAAKIFTSQGSGTTADINAAFDDLYGLRDSLNLKVVNCSFGIANGGQDPTQRAKVNTMAEHGMVVVASSGNGGTNGGTGDPGRASEIITVGAVNDLNQLTQYTSGAAKGDSDTDDKPDLVAPGGSSYTSKILSVDSNSADASRSSFADVQADDYTSDMGTSMAAPVVSGAAALLIQALEAQGLVWDFDSSDSTFLVKMLLLASATETNQPRETNAGNPPLGRGASPKDTYEGFGMLNPDAAIEAGTTTWAMDAPWTGTTTGAPGDRRAWGRKITVPAGQTLKLTLTSPPTADFDVYVYDATPSEIGTPVSQMWSDAPGAGVTDVTTWTFLPQTDLYVFVKRISGSGTFSLSGETFTCGDGHVDPGEQCDDGNVSGGDCCSVACQIEPAPCGVSALDATDGGADVDAGDDDASVTDGGGVSVAPPLPEPDNDDAGTTAVTAPPTSTGGTSGTVAVAPTTERYEVGGCASSPSSPRGSIALAFAVAALARRRRRS